MLSAGSVFGVLGSAAVGVGAGVFALMLSTGRPAAQPVPNGGLAAPAAAVATSSPAASPPAEAAGASSTAGNG